MLEGYHCRGEGDCSYSWLDELLCEYVDGTMDPAVRKSFEECLRKDPALARQVARLRRTRLLLCRHGCQIRAPEGLQARVRRHLAWEMMRTQRPVFSETLTRLGAYAAFASALLIVLMTGMLVGAYFYDEQQQPLAERRAEAPRRMASELLRPGLRQAAMTPLIGQQPMRQPWFVGRPDPVLLSPTQVHHLLQEAAPREPAPVPTPLLQRTGGAP